MSFCWKVYKQNNWYFTIFREHLCVKSTRYTVTVGILECKEFTVQSSIQPCHFSFTIWQGSHRVWKTWKNKIFWKSHGKSWKFFLWDFCGNPVWRQDALCTCVLFFFRRMSFMPLKHLAAQARVTYMMIWSVHIIWRTLKLDTYH